jgi:hypothetical protein
MTNPMQLRDDERLHTLLRESRPAPRLPPRFRESVWRRIERGEAPVAATYFPFAWLERWAERLLLPRVALASLALLLVVGALTGILASAGVAKQQAQERYLSTVAPNPLR